MEKLTITEALSEINLLKKKIEKKKETVLTNLIKAKHIKDQLESQGGAKAFVKAEIQSTQDLNSRLLRLKGAIAKANIETLITVNSRTDSIHNWLNWKRDIAQGDIKFNGQVYQSVKSHFDHLQKSPQVFKDEEGKTQLVEYESNVDYGDFLKTQEGLQDTFDKLDGQLSLKNATIVVEF